jgi:putative PIN family toxin of toxin-antitoxin system
LESLRVVIDTSSLISYILTKGEIMSQVMAAWRKDDFILLSSPDTRAELSAVLNRPEIQKLSSVSLAPFAEGVEKFSQHVPGQLKFKGISRDPKDDKFLACAVEGKAHYLVSSDNDLLEIGKYETVCILNPGQFLIALHVARLSSDTLRTQYSLETLNKIQNELCLEPKTQDKLGAVIDSY